MYYFNDKLVTFDGTVLFSVLQKLSLYVGVLDGYVNV